MCVGRGHLVGFVLREGSIFGWRKTAANAVRLILFDAIYLCPDRRNFIRKCCLLCDTRMSAGGNAIVR